MRYIYFGTSEFAAIILERLINKGLAPIAVVTRPDQPARRGKKLQESPVKALAKKYNVSLLQPEKIADYRLQITDLNPDVCIVAAYGGIIPKAMLDIPKHGCLNVHPSLLPKYRGPSPIQTAVLNGDTETGITIMLLDAKVDHGPILTHHTEHITQNVITPELEKELATLGAELLIKTMRKWIVGKITAVPQDHTKATFTKMITKEDGHIDWKKSAQELERHVRAMTPWPGSYTFWKENKKEVRLHLRKVSIIKKHVTEVPGKVLNTSSDEFVVACGKGMLAIHELQPESKHIMTAKAFLNGHRSIIGAVLE